MSAFEVQGNTIAFTAATSAPSAVQCVSNNQEMTPQYVVTNVGAVTAFLAWSPVSAAAAAANAVIPTSTSTYVYPMLAGTQVTISVAPGAWFTAITGSSTAVIYVTPGTGE